MHHNSVCLANAWCHIGLGFSVTPRDLVSPNPVKMLLLVAHLYKILPTYNVERELLFTVTLNSSQTQVVVFENPEESLVTYHVEILPENTSFMLKNPSTFVLKRKSKVEIFIEFVARSLTKVEGEYLFF